MPAQGYTGDRGNVLSQFPTVTKIPNEPGAIARAPGVTAQSIGTGALAGVAVLVDQFAHPAHGRHTFFGQDAEGVTDCEIRSALGEVGLLVTQCRQVRCFGGHFQRQMAPGIKTRLFLKDLVGGGSAGGKG